MESLNIFIKSIFIDNMVFAYFFVKKLLVNLKTM